ncbi:MAG: FadR/GntR family transcriptional regulator [Acidimicrobiales bacterium]
MSVTDEAIARIKELIVTGQLGPGDRIPREADLAAQLGLSRSSLREAVRALAMIRVLDVRQGDGTYVSSLEPGPLLESVGFVTELLAGGRLLEIMEVRRLLESAATAMAAVSIGDDDLATLAGDIAQMRAASTAEELIEVDARFHDTIARAAGNLTLAHLLQGFAGRIHRVRVGHVAVREGGVEVTHRGHDAILSALSGHNPELARAAALLHVAETESWIRTALVRAEPLGGAEP